MEGVMEDGEKTEQAQAVAEKPYYDAKIVRAFLNARWKFSPCDLCSEMNWNLGRTEAFPAAAIGLVDAGGNKTESYWPVLPVICTNCGNTKLLFLLVVNDWLQTEEGREAVKHLGAAE